MQIVSYNIQYGTGRDGRVDLNRIADECRGADVIALQEVERFFERSGNVDQVAELARLFPDYHYVYGAGVDIGIDTIADDGTVIHRRRTFGNMLLSRFPIVASRNHLLPKYGSVSPPMSIQRSALEGIIETPAGRLRVYSIHLSHLTSEERVDQVQALLDTHHAAVLEGFPVAGDLASINIAPDIPEQTVPREALMLGDFNMEPDSIEYEMLVGPDSPYGGRVVNADGLVDVWVAAGNDPMKGATSDVDGRPARLDYGFISTAMSASVMSCRVDTNATGSDHLPFWIELTF